MRALRWYHSPLPACRRSLLSAGPVASPSVAYVAARVSVHLSSSCARVADVSRAWRQISGRVCVCATSPDLQIQSVRWTEFTVDRLTDAWAPRVRNPF